jgi:hypothetical protein
MMRLLLVVTALAAATGCGTTIAPSAPSPQRAVRAAVPHSHVFCERDAPAGSPVLCAVTVNGTTGSVEAVRDEQGWRVRTR